MVVGLSGYAVRRDGCACVSTHNTTTTTRSRQPMRPADLAVVHRLSIAAFWCTAQRRSATSHQSFRYTAAVSPTGDTCSSAPGTTTPAGIEDGGVVSRINITSAWSMAGLEFSRLY